MSRQSFARYILKCPSRTLQLRLFISSLIGYVFGGFVHGLIFSATYSSLIDRIKHGVAESVMGIWLFGLAWEFGQTANLWPYIALTTSFVFVVWMIGGYLRELSS
jgi:hypothetical protein